MAPPKHAEAQARLSVWERAEPEKRPAPPPLSRRAITTAAIAIADADGLDAVSFRNVGAALKSSPMRLYACVSSKAELLDLMVDAVYAQMMAAGPFAGDWRGSLSAIAYRLRDAAHEHGWFIELVGTRPQQGPGGLAFLEASHAALDAAAGFDTIDKAMRAMRATYAYALGAIRLESGEARAERESGLTKEQWRTENGGYLLRRIAMGDFPTLARIVTEHAHPSFHASFEDGLGLLLDGIAVNLSLPAQKAD